MVRVAHEQVVVFDTCRPVRSKAVFETGADGAAPTRCTCRGKHNVADRGPQGVAVAGDWRAALHVKQRRIPGPADLSCEEADAVGPCTRGECRIEDAYPRVAEVRPITLSFQAEHKLIGLPSVADLSAEQSAGTIPATIS